jgi:hypothetical protein
MDMNTFFLRSFIISLVLILLSGCQLIRVQKASFKTTTPLTYDANAKPIFNPGGKESFILKDKASYLHKKGFVKFCHSTANINCKNKLPYLRYVGMKGYFDKSVAVKGDGKSYEFYPVVLENGDKYFFLSLKKDGGKYGANSPIKSLSLNENFTPRAVFENSQVKILGQYSSFGDQYYTLSNDDVIKQSQLDYIREISSNYKNQSKINNLLLKMDIEKSIWYDSYLISPRFTDENNGIKLFIGLNDSRQWLRYKVSHTGDKSLAVNAYTIVADELKWKSPKLIFETKQVADKVYESFEITANQKERSLINALSKASRSLIRIHGDSGSAYHQLKAQQKRQLSDVLSLYALLDKSVP